MITIKITREYCIVSKKLILEEKTVYLFGIRLYKKDIKKSGHIPEGFDIQYGKLVRVDPWPATQQNEKVSKS